MLPTLGMVHRRPSELMEDPEPVMQQLVRVIDDGTFCPGFQFLPGGQLQPTVMALFQRALDRQIPHNFTLWMVTPSRDLLCRVHFDPTRQVPLGPDWTNSVPRGIGLQQINRAGSGQRDDRAPVRRSLGSCGDCNT